MQLCSEFTALLHVHRHPCLKYTGLGGGTKTLFSFLMIFFSGNMSLSNYIHDAQYLFFLMILLQPNKKRREPGEQVTLGHFIFFFSPLRILLHSRLLGRHPCAAVTWVLCVSAYRFGVSRRILEDSIQHREKERERLSRTREKERESIERERERK